MDSTAQPPLIVCSTARLARGIRLAHARQQRSMGSVQWAPLPAVTLFNWLNEVIEQALLVGEVDVQTAPSGMLNTMQERLLWEQVIETELKHLDTAPLFDKTGLANAAQEANRLLIEWNLDLPADETTEETQQFLLWRQRFSRRCKQSGWLESVRYMNWQIQCIEAGQGDLPEEIAYAGFDRFSPQQKRLFAALEARGVEMHEYRTGSGTAQQSRQVQLTDQDAECRAAVAWAKELLSANPEAKVAIIVPELAALRGKLAALLDEALQPQVVTPALAHQPRVYDFSLGLPLNTQPVIATALDVLRFAARRQPVPQAEISALLQSPFWSDNIRQADSLAMLDARMRELLPLVVSPSRFLFFAQKNQQGEYALPLASLLGDIEAMFAASQSQPRLQLPSAWCHAFTMILQAANWPGKRTLSSHEYQARQAFERVLKAFAQLDMLLGKIGMQEAIMRLTQLCKEQIFQPEAKDARLQVMGMLEACAEPQDAIWVMGMNDHVWPPPPRPNPLLPAGLQRARATPNADSAVQTEFAQAIHQRLLRSAEQIIFSSAGKDGERQLRVSPMLQGITMHEQPMETVTTLAEQLAVSAAKSLLQLDDSQAPAVAAGEHVSGGTGLLKAQAICPAWAFYQYRLHARVLKEPVNGLDVMERGTLVHSVLEHFWENRGFAEVKAMSAETLQQAVDAAAGIALKKFNAKQDEPFSPAFLALEHARLAKLSSAWVQEIELNRPQGFTVTAREQRAEIPIESINIRLVVDRIDTLDDGRLVVMDYKTGRNNDFKNWAEVRIVEPQLPIYAAFVLSDKDVAAVCFAQVRKDKNAFIGIAESAEVLQGVAALNDNKARKIFIEADFPDWPSLVMHWKTSIEAIARELKSGEAAVRFQDEKQLVYCEVLPLLRLPERQLQFERLQAGQLQTDHGADN